MHCKKSEALSWYSIEHSIPSNKLFKWKDWLSLNYHIFMWFMFFFSFILKVKVLLSSVWLFVILCPWYSPGKNIGVGCHFLLQGDQTQVSSIAGRFFSIWATREALWRGTPKPQGGASCVNLGKLPNFSEPQFSHLWIGEAGEWPMRLFLLTRAFKALLDSWT